MLLIFFEFVTVLKIKWYVERDTSPSHFSRAHNDQGCFLVPHDGGRAEGGREGGRARVTSGAITAIATRQPTPTWIAAAAHLVEKVLT